PSGRPIKGQHEPLVDNDTWLKVCEVVKPKRRRTGERAARRKYLLAGVIRCGVCGRRLRGAWYKQENNHYYHCVANQPGRCPGVMGSGRTIDGLVTDLVLDYLAERTVATAEETWPKAAELEAAEARTVELMAAYDAGELDGKYVFPRVQEKEEQIAKLREEQTAWLREHSGPRSTNVAEAWPSLEVEQRRAVIASVIEAVVLRRPDRPRSKFDPERLEVVWKA
ncbi:zinc ribbon domain-containing protein, partial [Frankia casuarinae]|uniref:zinc ribbon domain-containing protein n=2 Tax=Frankia TaxID=1854 RepID=UPI0036F1D601